MICKAKALWRITIERPFFIPNNIWIVNERRINMEKNIPELYGCLVFNDKGMRAKLPKDMYKALKKTIDNGIHL